MAANLDRGVTGKDGWMRLAETEERAWKGAGLYDTKSVDMRAWECVENGRGFAEHTKSRCVAGEFDLGGIQQ